MGLSLLDGTKNGERREIPINDTLRLLAGYYKTDRCPYVFYEPKHGKSLPGSQEKLPDCPQRSGIKDFHFHDLRHTFASQLVMAGVDITTVKDLLGHKRLNMTLRYAHLAPSHRVKAVDVLDTACLMGRLAQWVNVSLIRTIQNLYNWQEISRMKLRKWLIYMVGTRGIEPLTSSVSRKRSPTELRA